MTTLGVAAAPEEVVAALLDADGGVTSRREVPVDPDSPDAVWQAVLRATRALLADGAGADAPTSLGLTTPTPVCVMWDAETLGCPLPLAAGTRLAPWLAEVARTAPRTLDALHEGRYAVGSLASYLVARATRGTHLVTDTSHAAGLGPAPDGVPEECLAELRDLPADPPVPGAGVPLDARSFLGLDLTLTVLRADLDAESVARFAGGHH